MDEDSAVRRERFRAVYRENRPAVLGYAVRRVDESADAADVVAETFLVAWRRLDDVPSGPLARAWLFAVARRVLANHRRGAVRRRLLADRLRGVLDEHVQLGEVSGAGDGTDRAVAAVREAVERLSEDDRELLRLTSWEGLSPTELATAMEIPPSTVRVRLHRARHRLRAVLESEGALPAVERWRTGGHLGTGEQVLASGTQEEP
jgi:RNA polymerase sigma-70 factor (ECF subfamily)